MNDFTVIKEADPVAKFVKLNELMFEPCMKLMQHSADYMARFLKNEQIDTHQHLREQHKMLTDYIALAKSLNYDYKPEATSFVAKQPGTAFHDPPVTASSGGQGINMTVNIGPGADNYGRDKQPEFRIGAIVMPNPLEPITDEGAKKLEEKRRAWVAKLSDALDEANPGDANANQREAQEWASINYAFDKFLSFTEELVHIIDAKNKTIMYYEKEANKGYAELATWKDKYNRDVEGLNNEGDAIGGEPPSGLRHRNERQANEIKGLSADLVGTATELNKVRNEMKQLIEERNILAKERNAAIQNLHNLDNALSKARTDMENLGDWYRQMPLLAK